VSESVETHGLLIEFGKYKGQRWTRLPLHYLKWLANDAQGEPNRLAKLELDRRGVILEEIKLELSAHSIDRASQNCRKEWHTTKREGEGLYSWLLRVASEVMVEGQEVAYGNGLKFIYQWGEYFPVLKTVMPHAEPTVQ